ncbi:MAG: RNA polymerase sigma factor [Anaerolineaceae bacterium]|nr:RNA polymerase sigma factor [Anaerolineaceae bacterium]
MDKSSFEQLYLQQLPGLYRLAMSILHHRDDAQDAVQQSVLEAWKKVDHIQGGKEKAYLARIVINECHNIQRRRQRVTPVFAFPEQSKDNLTAEVCVLKESLNAIPEKLRTPFLLVYMEGYSEKEAAEALGITLYSVKSRLKRSKQKLKIELGEEDAR